MVSLDRKWCKSYNCNKRNRQMLVLLSQKLSVWKERNERFAFKSHQHSSCISYKDGLHTLIEFPEIVVILLKEGKIMLWWVVQMEFFSLFRRLCTSLLKRKGVGNWTEKSETVMKKQKKWVKIKQKTTNLTPSNSNCFVQISLRYEFGPNSPRRQWCKKFKKNNLREVIIISRKFLNSSYPKTKNITRWRNYSVLQFWCHIKFSSSSMIGN